MCMTTKLTVVLSFETELIREALRLEGGSQYQRNSMGTMVL